ncbi:MAG TPA: hypothetical protein VK892_18805 [Pyrinomonadaceae bacterium]|nr:hypothetical protein [Pyrinomonadaceae bacterium]
MSSQTLGDHPQFDMRIIERVTEAEMIATFLRAEIRSSRFGKDILRILKRDRASRKVIDNPNVRDAAENEYRAALLGEFRGFGRNEEIFMDFPNDVEWHRTLLSRSDLLKIRYMNYSYWIDLSGGSRLVADAAKRVAAGEIEKATADWIRAAADAVKRGASFPEPILVSRNRQSDLIVLEGHLRMTAYLLSLDYLPAEMPMIVGYSEGIKRWDES